MKEEVPETLFKYKPFNDYTFTNIFTDTIWLSNYRQLNDPSELSLLFNKDKIVLDYLKSHPELVCSEEMKSTDYWEDGTTSLIDEITNLFQDRLRVFSMTNCGPCSNLMWAHYGGESKGICIEYDINSLRKDFKDEIEKVIYKEKPNDFTDEMLKSLNDLRNKQEMNDTDLIWFKEYFRQKSLHWEYEQEWRIIAVKPIVPDQAVVAPKIKCIYAGVRMEPEKFYALNELCKYKNICLKQIGIQPGTYNLFVKE